MASAQDDFQKAQNNLINLLKNHEAVLDFKEAQKGIEQIPELKHLAGQMKAHQQEAVLFQKIEKEKAQVQSAQQADRIKDELDDLPIVQDYRKKMQDASDLVQYVTKSIEEKINEELRHG